MTDAKQDTSQAQEALGGGAGASSPKRSGPSCPGATPVDLGRLSYRNLLQLQVWVSEAKLERRNKVLALADEHRATALGAAHWTGSLDAFIVTLEDALIEQNVDIHA